MQRYRSRSRGPARQRFSASEIGATVVDGDGNTYDYVTIGTQQWLVENLKTTKYADDTAIPNKTGGAWDVDTEGAYCWYDDDISYKNPYGALYSYYTVVNAHGLAPTGWIIPTETDWEILIAYIGGIGVMSKVLKEAGLSHWLTPNLYATNEFGFTGLPGGERQTFAGFNFFTMSGFYIANTDPGTDRILLYELVYYMTDGIKNNSGFAKNDGVSVRCMRYI